MTGLANDETDTLLRAILRDVLGLAADRVVAFDADTGLFGALPELDSMAVAGLLVHAMFGRPHLHQHRVAMAEERADAAPTHGLPPADPVENRPTETATHKPRH